MSCQTGKVWCIVCFQYYTSLYMYGLHVAARNVDIYWVGNALTGFNSTLLCHVLPCTQQMAVALVCTINNVQYNICFVLCIIKLRSSKRLFFSNMVVPLACLAHTCVQYGPLFPLHGLFVCMHTYMCVCVCVCVYSIMTVLYTDGCSCFQWIPATLKPC